MNENDALNTTPQRCKVLIVGAGMAGLSAAYHLTKNGCTDFKLIEARSRIGGRIVQITLNNQPIELGANWIHGILGNPVYELAMEYDLVDILHEAKAHKIVATMETGLQAPFAILQECYEAYLCFLRRCEEYFVTQFSPPDGIDNVGDHIKLEVELYLAGLPSNEDRKIRELIFNCLLKRETCISGCNDMKQIDLLEIGSYTELQGGNILLKNGYSSILTPLINQIPQNAIYLNHPVSKINWSDDCTETGYESDDSDKTIKDSDANLIEIQCENGVNFIAEQLICTIPLGVLKTSSKTLFNPPLPDYKQQAIDNLLFGTVDKILLEFERPFLNPNISEVLLLWERDDCKDLEKNWYKKIYSFSKVSETLLLGWISGEAAEYMERLGNDEVVDKCVDILRRFLNDPFVPRPKNCVCTSWHSQPYTRGSYTAIAVGASQIDLECLAQPLYSDEMQTKPIVLFAGEHTHTNFYSTVHGAFLSGRTAAQMILQSEQTQEIVVDCEDTTDLSSWIQGICLE